MLRQPPPKFRVEETRADEGVTKDSPRAEERSDCVDERPDDGVGACINENSSESSSRSNAARSEGNDEAMMNGKGGNGRKRRGRRDNLRASDKKKGRGFDL